MMMRYYKRQEELKVRKRLNEQMEKFKIIIHSLPAHLPDVFCDVFRNSRKRMMIPTWIPSGQTDRL